MRGWWFTGRWLMELGPLAVVGVMLWAKLTYQSVMAPSEWWSNEGSIGAWMRPTVGFASALYENPRASTGTAASVLALVAPCALLPRGWRFACALVVSALLTALGLVDLLHVRFYGDVLSAQSFTTPRMLRDVMPSLPQILRGTDPAYAADLLVGAAMLPLYLRWVRRRVEIPGSGRLGVAGAGVAVGVATTLVGAAVWPAGAVDNRTSVTLQRVDLASTMGLLPYHLADLAEQVRGRPDPTAEDLVAVEDVVRAVQLPRERPPQLAGVAAGANVILVSAESLQAFPIGLVLDGQRVTPRLSALLQESLYFPNYHEQTHLGTTSDAQFSVLQGLHPLPVGFVAMQHARSDLRALPGLLRRRGYATFAAVAASSDFWNADVLHPTYGFERTYFEDDLPRGEMIGPWLADHVFLEHMAGVLATRPEPFMGYLLTSTNHHPYELPAAYRALRLGALEGTLLGRYLSSVHYFDGAFGEFVERLRASGTLDRSLLVVYGDHQGFLGDPPELATLLGLPSWDEYWRFHVRKRVPLIIRLPGAAGAGRIETVGGHVDVSPTILSLLGESAEGGLALGRDLTTDGGRMVVFRDGSFTDGRIAHLARVGGAPRCYEVGTGGAVTCNERLREEARDRLWASDVMLRSDLIGVMADRMASRQSRGGRSP